MLTAAFEENASKVKNHSISPTEAAVDMEYEIFSSNKIQQSYKLSFNKKVSWPLFAWHSELAAILTHQLKEIQSLTEQEVLYECLKAPIKETETEKVEPLGPDLVPPSRGVEEAASLTGFVKASRLVPAKREEEEGMAAKSKGAFSEGKTAAAFIPASQMLNPSSHCVTLGKSSAHLTSRESPQKPSRERKITDFFRGCVCNHDSMHLSCVYGMPFCRNGVSSSSSNGGSSASTKGEDSGRNGKFLSSKDGETSRSGDTALSNGTTPQEVSTAQPPASIH